MGEGTRRLRLWRCAPLTLLDLRAHAARNTTMMLLCAAPGTPTCVRDWKQSREVKLSFATNEMHRRGEQQLDFACSLGARIRSLTYP